MANNMNGFSCIGCGKSFGSGYGGYTCDDCSGNLDVQYDYGAVKKEFTLELLKNNPRKDVWRYMPLFPIENIKSVPPLSMGMTPLYRNNWIEADTGFSEVYLKDDTGLPSGSFKDRAGSVVMAVAREKGVEVVACASTGNAGCSWACMGAACGVKVIIYVPKTAPRAKIAQLKVYGSQIRIIDGTYDNAYDLCVKDCIENNYFNRCTGYNPYTREGKKSVSFEIWEQLNYRIPEAVFVPVGDGNIISGVWKGFRDLKNLDLIDRMPRLIAVQSEDSDAVTRTVEKFASSGAGTAGEIETVKATTIADSISVDKPRDGLAAVKSVIESGGMAVRVSDREIIDTIFYIASRSGIFAEPAGATSVAGLRKIADEYNKEHFIGPVVCLITGNGLKDIDAVLKDV